MTNNAEEKLTIAQAYKAMYHYLDALYAMTSSDDLAGFLGGMSLASDGQPADPAVLRDWHDAVSKALSEEDIDQRIS